MVRTLDGPGDDLAKVAAARQDFDAAAKQHGYHRAFAGAPSELRADREFVFRTVRKCGAALEFAVDELRADQEIVLTAVLQDGLALEYAASELQADRTIVLVAVRHDGWALEYAADELRGDRDIVLAAADREGTAFRFASPALRADRQTVVRVVRSCWKALRFASAELRGDHGVVVEALVHYARTFVGAAAGPQLPAMTVPPEVMALLSPDLQKDPTLLNDVADAWRARHSVGGGARNTCVGPHGQACGLDPAGGQGLLTYAQATLLQHELLERYQPASFQNELKGVREMGSAGTGGKAALASLCLPVQAEVLPRFGLEGSQAGVTNLRRAFVLLDLNSEVLAATNAVRRALGIPARVKARVWRAALQTVQGCKGNFDWSYLDGQEDKSLRAAPAEYTFRGRVCRISQKRAAHVSDPESTGSYVWPAALSLAHYFECQGQGGGDSPANRSVLELGAGTGLVGLALSMLGARKVLLTDLPGILPGLQQNIRLNAGPGHAPDVRAAELDWRAVAAGGELPEGGPFDLVCWADCVFWPELVAPLCTAVGRLAGPGTLVVFALVHRGQESRAFLQRLGHSFRVSEVWRPRGEQEEARLRQGDLRIYRAMRP